MTTRKIRKPVGFNGEELNGYFMITNRDAATAILNKLTGSQLRLWLYLMMTDTYADFTRDGDNIFHPLPSPAEMAIKIGVSPDTVEKDMRKLKKLELYSYRITAWQGHNLSAAKAREESKRLKNNKAQTQSKKASGLNKPPEELNKPPFGLNNPPDRLNKPSEKATTLEKIRVSDCPQTIETIQTLSDRNEGERKTLFDLAQTEQPVTQDKDDYSINHDDGAYKPYGAFKGANEFAPQPLPNSMSFASLGFASLRERERGTAPHPVNTHVLVKREVQGDEQISPQRTTNRQQKVVCDWLPDGPWKINEKLDPNFRDFVAKDWVNRYGGTLYQRQADVLAHFKKDPANLPIRWEQYQREYLHRYQNTQTLLNNGVSIDEEYQHRLITNHRAVSEPLPDELNPVAIPQPISSIEEADLEDDWKRQIPPGAENPQAYKPYVVPSIADEAQVVSADEALAKGKEMIAFLKAKIAQKFNMPPADLTPLEKDKALTELERLNEWIKDPMLRREVEHKLRTSNRYHVEYDEEGIPYKVTEQLF